MKIYGDELSLVLKAGVDVGTVDEAKDTVFNQRVL